MSRLTTKRRFAPALASALLTVIGLLMAIFGEGSDRAWGFVTVLMFGVGGGAWVAGEWFTPPAQRPHNGVVALPSGAVVPALVFPLREGKVRASVISIAAFFSASVALAVFTEAFGEPPEVRLFWIACAGLLGLTLAAVIRRRDQRDYLLALTRGGIVSRLPAEARFVPWPAVRAATVVERLGQRYLALDLNRSAQVEQEGGFPGDELGNRLMTGRDWSFPLGSLPMEPAELLVVIRTYLDDPGRRSELGSTSALAALK
jgi:hypothetical protein